MEKKVRRQKPKTWKEKERETHMEQKMTDILAEQPKVEHKNEENMRNK